MPHPLLNHQLVPERQVIAAKRELADAPADELRLVRSGQQYIGRCPCNGASGMIITSDPDEAFRWLDRHEKEQCSGR